MEMNSFMFESNEPIQWAIQPDIQLCNRVFRQHYSGNIVLKI